MEDLLVRVGEGGQVHMRLLCHHLRVIDGQICFRLLKCLRVKIEVLSNCHQLLRRVILFEELA